LVLGDLGAEGTDPLVRVQVASPASDLFGRTALLEASLAAIRVEGRGAFVYMHVFDGGQDGSRVMAQLRKRLLPDSVEERPDSDESHRALREFGTGAQVLVHLGITRMRLMTNHPRRIVGLDAYGIEVSETVPIDLEASTNGETMRELQRVVASVRGTS
jgi:3,4-dihydroxy 2-butanone 4-phosphate synthase/GTP cyclohydrolase II